MSIFTGAANWNIQRTSSELVVGAAVGWARSVACASASAAGALAMLVWARGEGGDWVVTSLTLLESPEKDANYWEKPRGQYQATRKPPSVVCTTNAQNLPVR